MKKLFIVTILASFIAVCNSIGISANAVNLENQYLTEEQKIEEEFNLPPEPDPEINNATINGVDFNKNKIRDDWERAIAFKYHEDIVLVNLHNHFAELTTDINNAYDENNVDAYRDAIKSRLRVIDCIFFLFPGNAGDKTDLFDMKGNTKTRKFESWKRSDNMQEYVSDTINKRTPKEQLESTCSKYQN